MCEFHGLPIGSRVSKENWYCTQCDQRGIVDYKIGTYMGDESPTIHLVKLDDPLVCPTCGHKNALIRVPCGTNGIIVELIDVTLELKIHESV